MQKIEINITSEEVYGGVYRLSNYAAAKLTGEDAKIYENVRATKYNKDVLDGFFKEAANAASAFFSKYITTIVPSGTAYKATMYVSEKANPAALQSVKLQGFFVHYILSKWYLTCNVPELAKEETEEYLSVVKEIIALINTLVHPKRPAQVEGIGVIIKGQETWKEE